MIVINAVEIPHGACIMPPINLNFIHLSSFFPIVDFQGGSAGETELQAGKL